MAEVASETLTFLFTDLEGSTALWERHPTTMGAALSRHDAILHELVARHRGALVKSTGDGLFAVFPSARDGVGAAIAAQRALDDAEWPDGISLRVRMGVHAGDATQRDGDWYGTEVNRAARVMAVAHGGQVVCTRIVEELVRDEFDLVDLGEHRLRDLQSSVHLFQVEVPGAPAIHPPLRSLDAYRSNLPYQLSSFIGREQEQHNVAQLVANSRLVSIVGVGGVGKTRLALQVGSELLPRYEDGVWVCELATVLDPDDLHDAVAAALRFTPPQGVSVVVGLQQYFEHRQLLLILDNCEHLVDAVASFVTETTMRAPGMSVLATSREALGVRGEHITPLASLSTPSHSDPGAVLASEAGALFVTRAREARGNLAVDDRTAGAVHALCTRLDGIPLALELAAAQTTMMTPQEIERRLDRQFRLAAGGRRTALERHQTLRAAIDWSYDLLSHGARRLLDRLSVCVGGFDLDAAVAIAAGIDDEAADGFDLLGELVAKSLVERYEVDGATRYRQLEMIRQYAADQLNGSGDDETTRDLHAQHYLARAVELVTEARTEREYEAFDALGLETPNLATGLRWLLATQRIEEVLAFYAMLPFLDYFAFPSVALEELGTIAEDAVEQDDAAELDGFSAACFLASFRLLGDVDRYRWLADRARAATERGVSVGIFVCDSMIALFAGELDVAASLVGQAVETARTAADPALLAWVLAHYSMMESMQEYSAGDPGRRRALAAAEEALSIARREPGSVIRLYPLIAVAAAHHVVDTTRALEAADEAMRLDRTQRKWWATVAGSMATTIRATGGSAREKLPEWRAVLVGYHDRGERIMFSTNLIGISESLAPSEPELAADLAAIAESDAIAPIAAFAVQPGLIRLGLERPDLVSAARNRASTMSYDDAVADVFAAIDTVMDRHDLRGTEA